VGSVKSAGAVFYFKAVIQESVSEPLLYSLGELAMREELSERSKFKFGIALMFEQLLHPPRNMV
jgi:hypothetical protein